MKSKKLKVFFIGIIGFLVLLFLLWTFYQKNYEFKEGKKWLSEDNAFCLESSLTEHYGYDVVVLTGYIIINNEKSYVEYNIRVTGDRFDIFRKTDEEYDDFFLKADFYIDIKENIVLKNVTFIDTGEKLAKKIVLYKQ